MSDFHEIVYFHGAGSMRIFITAVLALFVLIGHGAKEEEAKKAITCESFGFRIKQEEWSNARQKMYQLAVESPPKYVSRLRFVDDTSLGDIFPHLLVSIEPIDDIVVEDQIMFPGKYVLSNMRDHSGYAVLALTSDSDKHCKEVKPLGDLFAEAKRTFSQQWKLFDITSSSSLTPYDQCMVDGLRKRNTAEDKCLAECIEKDSAGSIGGGCYHVCFAHRKDRDITTWLPPEAWAKCEE